MSTVVRYKRKNIAQQVNQTFAFCHKGLWRSKDDHRGLYTHSLTSYYSWMVSLVNVNLSEPSKWCLKTLSTILRKSNYQLDLIYFLHGLFSHELPLIRFFSRVTKFTTMEKMCNFYICVTTFLQIKNVLLANNTGYVFCVLNVLRCKGKLDSGENYWIYGVIKYREKLHRS